MKTDTIFYSLFQEFPRFFFELIHRSPEEAAAYEFTSREIKQLAFRIDGLFLPKTDEPDKPFYLVEFTNPGGRSIWIFNVGLHSEEIAQMLCPYSCNDNTNPPIPGALSSSIPVAASKSNSRSNSRNSSTVPAFGAFI